MSTAVTDGAARRARTNELALLGVIAVVVMLFAGFTAAYLVRRTGSDWGHVVLPRLLWLSTGIIVLSSVTLEVARRTGSRAWLRTTLLLGGIFVVSQLAAWRRLAAQGVFAASHPHASFFYMLTGVHGLHLLGGIAALLVAARRGTLGVCAGYWHFVGLLWVYVFLMLHRL